MDAQKSQLGITHKDIYKYVCSRLPQEASAFKEKFKAVDVTHLIAYHSHNKDGYLSFTDFNQMVLPTCNIKLRAEATQRANIIRARMFGDEELETSSAEEKLVQLLIAEICFNLDLEVMKARIESTDGGFST